MTQEVRMESHLDSLNTHHWIPERGKTALIMIDLQEYFREIICPILNDITQIIRTAREKAIPVFFTKHGHKKDDSAGMLGKWWADLIKAGSPEANLLPELDIKEDDLIIPKDRYSAFYQTGLEKRLQDLGISDVVIGGVMTNLCCETTARDAFVRNFRVFFLADGTSTANEDFHQATLKNLGYGFATLMTCQQLGRTVQTW
jgi:nicotinamidase-related amidase